MKRLISLLLTAVMLFALIPFSALGVTAEDATDAQGVTYSLSEDGTYYSVTNFNGSVSEVVIPSNYNDLPVTSIGDSAFYGCTGLTSVTIPDSVTSIGVWAFYGCFGLTSINIPDSVIYIWEFAFSGCSGLTSITIPDSVTSIGDYAFYGCSGLETVTVAEGNTTYHSEGNCLIKTETKTLILGCKSSVIPDDGSVTSIGYAAFNGCTGLTSITIPDSTTSIGNSAFYGCFGLTSITIPDSVTFIGDYAFDGCSGLETITVAEGNTTYHSEGNCLIETETKTLIAGCKNSVIPDDGSVTSIGNSAFDGCSGLTSVTIPDSVTSIGSWAFYGCSGLTSITIPDSVTSIYENAFDGCTDLTSIIIPDSVTSIEMYAFSGCTGLTDIYCEAEEQPEGWYSDWNFGCDATVHWGYKVPENYYGNINGDGKVNISDCILIKRGILNTYSMTEDQTARADINEDGKVNISDYILCKRIILGTFSK